MIRLLRMRPPRNARPKRRWAAAARTTRWPIRVQRANQRLLNEVLCLGATSGPVRQTPVPEALEIRPHPLDQDLDGPAVPFGSQWQQRDRRAGRQLPYTGIGGGCAVVRRSSCPAVGWCHDCDWHHSVSTCLVSRQPLRSCERTSEQRKANSRTRDKIRQRRPRTGRFTEPG